jgi:Protein of unknown function (DUF1579)
MELSCYDFESLQLPAPQKELSRAIWFIRCITETASNPQQKSTAHTMKHQIAYLGSAFLVAGTLTMSLARASENAQKFDPAMEEMMKKAEAACTPGIAHQALEPLVGEWNVEVKTWMTPDAQPTISTGTAKSTWTLKGRFVQQEFSGEFMGQPFHGISFTGYDNVREKYRSVWIDDMSTTMVVSEGDADGGGKVITLGGSYACAMTGEKDKTTTQIYRILSPDKHVFEMHDPARGEHSKVMEITYIRK